jgi:hypothetical protein
MRYQHKDKTAVELRTSLEAWVEFFERSTIWEDMVNMLETGVMDGYNELGDIGAMLSEREADIARGRLEQLKEILDWPEIVASVKMQQNEDAEDEIKRGERDA